MSNDFLAVFLYRYESGRSVHFGESRDVSQHYPSTVLGVATRPVGQPIEHHSTTEGYVDIDREEFVEHVEETADDVRWFDEPLNCEGEDDE